MNIRDFCKGREVNQQAVYKYVQRHSETFKGHVRKIDREYDLDDDAIKILDNLYPYPNPAVIVQGVPHEEHERVLKELDLMKDKVIFMQDRLNELSSSKALLEDRNRQLAEVKLNNEDLSKQVLELSLELEREKSKSWLDKLLRR